MERAVGEFGRIDIVVNNAGFAAGGGTVAAPIASEIDALLAVHLTGTLATMAAAFPRMAAQGWGRVVNTVSEVALDARYSASLGYSVAKAAVWSATLVAAREGAEFGITVNAISPGARTRMNADLLDAGFRDGASAALDLDPAHVARVAAFLVSEEAADVTGRIVHVAGPSRARVHDGAVVAHRSRRPHRALARRLTDVARPSPNCVVSWAIFGMRPMNPPQQRRNRAWHGHRCRESVARHRLWQSRCESDLPE